jgi:hypothetical protein
MLKRSKLYATVLNEEHTVGVFALVEDFMIVFVTVSGSTRGNVYEKAMSVNLIRQKCVLHIFFSFEAGTTLSVTGDCRKITVIHRNTYSCGTFQS